MDISDAGVGLVEIEQACKPDSVVDDHLSCFYPPTADRNLCDLLGIQTSQATLSLFDLAPGGVWRTASHLAVVWELLPPSFTFAF